MTREEEIEKLLKSGEIGLLTEVAYGGVIADDQAATPLIKKDNKDKK